MPSSSSSVSNKISKFTWQEIIAVIYVALKRLPQHQSNSSRCTGKLTVFSTNWLGCISCGGRSTSSSALPFLTYNPVSIFEEKTQSFVSLENKMAQTSHFKHPMRTRRTRSSDKTHGSEIDLLSVCSSGCITRGQINRVKKIISECPISANSDQVIASKPKTSIRGEKMPTKDIGKRSDYSFGDKANDIMKRKRKVLFDQSSKSPEKKACRSYELLSTSLFCLPEGSEEWIRSFLKWNAMEKIQVLEGLINICQPHEVRHMLEIIEPQFQRDFISLLPKELALHVLAFLEPCDLLVAAQTCKYWRMLSEDNLMWKNKCLNEGITEPYITKAVKGNWRNKKSFVGMGIVSTWKAAYLRHARIEMNWRVGKQRISKVLKGHDDHVITCLQFNGSRIVSGSDDNTLKVWSAISGKCLRTLTGHTGGVWASQMRKSLIISGSTDRTLKIWNADTGNCVHTLYGHTSTVRCLALHDNMVVSGSRDATLRVWNIEDGACLHVLMGHMAAVRCVCYDGKRIVSGAYDYMVKVWDPDTEECIHTLQGHTNRVYSLQFDGTYVVSGSLDTSIRVWEVEGGTCLHTLMGHQSLTSGMVLRGHTLVSGNADSTVKVWDILTGECLKTLEGSNKHLSAVTCLQFRGKFIITSSDDGTVKLWDINTGKVIRDLVTLESRGSGGVVWRIRASQTKLVCAFGSRNGTEETKLMVLDFDPESK